MKNAGMMAICYIVGMALLCFCAFPLVIWGLTTDMVMCSLAMAIMGELLLHFVHCSSLIDNIYVEEFVSFRIIADGMAMIYMTPILMGKLLIFDWITE